MGFRKEKKPFFHVREVRECKVPAPPGLDSSLSWYLVYTSPRMEAKAAKGLLDAGCSVFLPAIERVIRFQRRETESRLATFPRYLFAAGVPTQRRDRNLVAADGVSVITINGRPITDIREIEGVHDIVRTPEGWARVPRQAIEAVAAFQNDAVEPRKDILHPDRKLAPGQQMLINRGPFMSFLAVVVDQIGLREADVLINIFGRQSPLRIDVDSLDAA